MIPFLFFLLFGLIWAGIAYLATTRAMRGPWQRDEPAVIGRRLQSRNRTVLVVTGVVIVLAAVMEWLVPGMSQAVQDLQYGVGDVTGSNLTMVSQSTNGSLSWGFYLAILLGTALGLIGGTAAAARKYPVLRGLSPVQI